MRKKLLYSFALLFLLTAATAFFSSLLTENMVWPALLILLLSAIKFATVALEFMELRTAHPAWRIILFVLLGILLSCIAIMRMGM